MSQSDGYVNDPTASTTEYSDETTLDSSIALLKAMKNQNIDIIEALLAIKTILENWPHGSE